MYYNDIDADGDLYLAFDRVLVLFFGSDFHNKNLMLFIFLAYRLRAGDVTPRECASCTKKHTHC